MTAKKSQKNESSSVAQRLRTFRECFRGGMTQSEFADLLKIDQQRLSGYEARTKSPHHVIAELINLGVRVEWLLFGTGTMLREHEPAASIRSAALRCMEPQATYAGRD